MSILFGDDHSLHGPITINPPAAVALPSIVSGVLLTENWLRRQARREAS